MQIRRESRLLGAAVVTWVAISADAHLAQAQATQRNREGFNVTLRATATGEELNAQPDMWMLQVSFKPMRMIRVTTTDPATGETRDELVWYLVYRAINRKLEKQGDTSNTIPINDEDVPPTPLFVPEFTLVTQDDGEGRAYDDSIIPEAQAAIIRRERRAYQNPVEVVAELPPASQDSDLENAIYGVAMWRGVDPETDNFIVYMSGFSSAYRVGRDPEGNTIVLRKTIAQEYWRPGDRFNESEVEIRRREEPRWIYRAEQSRSAEKPSS